MTSIDDVYAERDRLVSALSKLYPAHLRRHEGGVWDDDWRNVVCIHLPSGQVSWHIPDRELELFAHLAMKEDDYDGHDTEEKYERLRHPGRVK